MEIPGDIFRFTRVMEKRLLVLLRSNLILPKSRMLPNYTLLIPPSDGYAYGNAGYIDTPGYSYCNFSGIKKAAGGVRGKTMIQTRNGTMFRISQVGAKVRIDRVKDGALVRETDWYYNTSVESSFEQTAYYLTITGNDFYCEGSTREWNSEISQYWTHSSFRSKNVKS